MPAAAPHNMHRRSTYSTVHCTRQDCRPTAKKIRHQPCGQQAWLKAAFLCMDAHTHSSSSSNQGAHSPLFCIAQLHDSPVVWVGQRLAEAGELCQQVAHRGPLRPPQQLPHAGSVQATSSTATTQLVTWRQKHAVHGGSDQRMVEAKTAEHLQAGAVIHCGAHRQLQRDDTHANGSAVAVVLVAVLLVTWLCDEL